MGKIVVKTACKMLLIIMSLALMAFAVASFGFPQHMATLSENIGWYSAAVNYSSLRYSYTGDVSDLARCAEDSILQGSDENIIEYCSQLIEHENFEALCEQKDEYFSSGTYATYTSSYKQYVIGKYAAALASTGEGEQAVEVALSANGLHSFANGNALATLAIWAAANGDSETCSLIVNAMGTITVPDEDSEYYASILKIVTNAAA